MKALIDRLNSVWKSGPGTLCGGRTKLIGFLTAGKYDERDREGAERLLRITAYTVGAEVERIVYRAGTDGNHKLQITNHK